jgi:hypothetical protein
MKTIEDCNLAISKMLEGIKLAKIERDSIIEGKTENGTLKGIRFWDKAIFQLHEKERKLLIAINYRHELLDEKILPKRKKEIISIIEKEIDDLFESSFSFDI